MFVSLFFFINLHISPSHTLHPFLPNLTYIKTKKIKISSSV